MTTSASWTLFDVAEVPGRPLPGRRGITAQALVDNTDPGGSTLLGLRYEPGATDPDRVHAVGHVIMVLEGELSVAGRPCGPGAGCFAPAHVRYGVQAGPDGAYAVEFRPAPIVYGRDLTDDAVMPVKPPTRPDPSFLWDLFASAGPTTSVRELSYYDIHGTPELRVSEQVGILTLVNHAEEDGQSVLMVHHGPGNFTPMHSHDVDQIVLVLEGTIHSGNRSFGPGTGFFTPKGKKYQLRAGEEGARRVEWRPSPLRMSTDWAEPRPDLPGLAASTPAP